jgi:hypothetical protein
MAQREPQWFGRGQSNPVDDLADPVRTAEADDRPQSASVAIGQEICHGIGRVPCSRNDRGRGPRWLGSSVLVEQDMDTARTDDHLVDAAFHLPRPPHRCENRPVRGGQWWNRHADPIVVQLLHRQSVLLVRSEDRQFNPALEALQAKPSYR